MSYYVITCDGKALHDSRLPEPRVLNPRCVLEVNTSGSLTFEMPVTHRYYDLPQKRKSIICVFQDGEPQPLFRGQVLNDEMRMNKMKSVTCEGDLAFLNDSVQRPYTHEGDIVTFLEQIIASHNEQCQGNRKSFEVGQVDIMDPGGSLQLEDSSYMSTFQTLSEKLLKSSLGGYIYTSGTPDRRYLNYTEQPGSVSRQTIRFGENLLDLKRFVRGEDIITALIPLGATLTGQPDVDNDHDYSLPALPDDNNPVSAYETYLPDDWGDT